MKLYQKIYCRTVQVLFRLAQPALPYREPEALDSIDALPELLKQLQLDRVLLVTDGQLRSFGITAALEKCLADNAIHCAVYDGTRPNPTVHNVEQARELYLQESCQALIAMGGGSAMDCAKAVGARIARPRTSVNRMGGTLRVLRRIPTLIAIPTTAGTGSETTLAAVITDSESQHKYSMNDFALIPRYCVLDPQVTYSLPPSLTATTGMDALTHAVEAYIGRSTNGKTRAKALEATRLIFENIERAYLCGSDCEARTHMLRAAYLAGEAFSVSYVGYVHAVAHSLGGQYNIPHGLANAVLLPIFLEAYGPAIYPQLHNLAIAAGISTPADSHSEGARQFIAAIRNLNQRMDIPQTLSGIRREDIPRMAKHAHREANPLYPVPVLMDAKALEGFYYKVADWSVTHDRH